MSLFDHTNRNQIIIKDRDVGRMQNVSETESEEVPLVGSLQIYWFPQVGGKMFTYPVDSLEHAVSMLDMLAKYDLFQFENKIKGDYTNHGGLQIWSKDDGSGMPGWVEWNPEEEQIDEFEEGLFPEVSDAMILH
jgi:hypothetical protein